MQAFTWLAEQHIEAAMRRGEFDNLPGKGQKLAFEDDSHVPQDLRMAYKILKNAGYAPAELAEQKEITSLIELLSETTDERERYRQIQKLNFLVMKMNERRPRPINLEADQLYYQKVVERVPVKK